MDVHLQSNHLRYNIVSEQKRLIILYIDEAVCLANFHFLEWELVPPILCKYIV